MSSKVAEAMKEQPTDKPTQAIKLDTETEVLRAIASVELVKGLVVLLAGFGAFWLLNRDVWDVAVSFLRCCISSIATTMQMFFLSWRGM